MPNITDVPQRYAMRGGEPQALGIIRRRGRVKQGKDDRPEEITGVRIVLLPPQ
jgi:hypothetical protein